MGLSNPLFDCFSLILELLVHVMQRLHLGLMLLTIIVELIHHYLDLEILFFYTFLKLGDQVLSGVKLILQVFFTNSSSVVFLLQFIDSTLQSFHFFRLLQLKLHHVGFFFRPTYHVHSHLVFKRFTFFIKLTLQLLD